MNASAVTQKVNGLAYLEASSAKELAEQSDPTKATMTP